MRIAADGYGSDDPNGRTRRALRSVRYAGEGVHGDRLRGLIVVFWRAGLRIHEALALGEALDARRGALLVRRGKAGAAAKSGWTTGHGTTLGHG